MPPSIQFKQLNRFRAHQLAVKAFRSNQTKTAFRGVKLVQRAHSKRLTFDQIKIGEIAKNNRAVRDIVTDDYRVAENRIICTTPEIVAGTVFQHTERHGNLIIHYPHSIFAIVLIQTEEQLDNCICGQCACSNTDIGSVQQPFRLNHTHSVQAYIFLGSAKAMTELAIDIACEIKAHILNEMARNLCHHAQLENSAAERGIAHFVRLRVSVIFFNDFRLRNDVHADDSVVRNLRMDDSAESAEQIFMSKMLRVISLEAVRHRIAAVIQLHELKIIAVNITELIGFQAVFKCGTVVILGYYKHLYGYRKGEDGKPVIVPEEAEVVKLIYKLYLDGMTLRQISHRLKVLNKTRREGQDWSLDCIHSLLSNEKYVGDALLQKSYTVDCITHKKVKNNGERAKYLVTDAHKAIIDRDTYNLVQQELARRTSMRKKSDKCTTEQGKYSSKYALTEIMVCAECGSVYRRQTWNIHGRKCPVWRCISRFDNGNRYCKKSPSLHEDKLHKAILSAINEYYDCKDNIKELLKSNVEQALAGASVKETKEIQHRLREIDDARNDYIALIASGTIDEAALDEQFQKIYAEEQELNSRLKALEENNSVDTNKRARLSQTLRNIDNSAGELTEYNDMLVRKLIECIKVISKTEIQIIFKGGIEIAVEVEK